MKEQLTTQLLLCPVAEGKGALEGLTQAMKSSALEGIHILA